jgi:hypothetical protein
VGVPTAYHQLGQFIVAFQHLEDSVNDLLVLLADTDDSAVRILANDLEYGKRLNTADVLFAYFVDVRNNTRAEAKSEFHRLIVELRELGERRNELVHSRYSPWIDEHGRHGLLRTNSKLSGSKGLREEREEELHPQAFDGDLQRLASAAAKLETFRLLVISWLYPEQ